MRPACLATISRSVASSSSTAVASCSAVLRPSSASSLTPAARLLSRRSISSSSSRPAWSPFSARKKVVEASEFAPKKVSLLNQAAAEVEASSSSASADSKVGAAGEQEVVTREYRSLLAQGYSRHRDNYPKEALVIQTEAFKTSPQKLNLLSKQIREKPIDEAILQMQFSHKRAARRVLEVLVEARKRAVEKGMNLGKLMIQASWVGKGVYLKRILPMGRGRAGIMHHPSSRIYIRLVEGLTHMEKEHVKHLKQLKAIKALGPNPHVRTPGGGMNNRQVQIERASIANWRW